MWVWVYPQVRSSHQMGCYVLDDPLLHTRAALSAAAYMQLLCSLVATHDNSTQPSPSPISHQVRTYVYRPTTDASTHDTTLFNFTERPAGDPENPLRRLKFCHTVCMKSWRRRRFVGCGHEGSARLMLFRRGPADRRRLCMGSEIRHD